MFIISQIFRPTLFFIQIACCLLNHSLDVPINCIKIKRCSNFLRHGNQALKRPHSISQITTICSVSHFRIMRPFYTGILYTDEPTNKTCLQREEQMIQSRFTYKKPSVKGLRDYLHEADRRLKGMEGNTRRCFRKTEVTWWQGHNSPASSLIWLYNSAVFIYIAILHWRKHGGQMLLKSIKCKLHPMHEMFWNEKRILRNGLRRAQLGWSLTWFEHRPQHGQIKKYSVFLLKSYIDWPLHLNKCLWWLQP